MPAPTSVRCQALTARPRARSQRRAGTMTRNSAPNVASTMRASRRSSVRAPSAAAGTAVTQ